ACQQIDDGPASLRIRSRGEVADWLIEKDVTEPLGRPHASAVDTDIVPCRVRLGAHQLDGLAVDGHATVGDQLFGRAARRDTRLRKDFLKSLALVWPRFPCFAPIS